MIVCGRNILAQFCEDYEELNDENIPFIKYPSKANLDLSKISSISTFGEFSVIVYKNGNAYGIGNNKNGQIHSSLPKEVLPKLTKINISDSQNESFKVISAVCFNNCTIYLLSGNGEGTKNKLFCASQFNDSQFLDIGDSNPIALYNMAAINDDGSITLIITTTNNLHAHRYFLPNDKAIKVQLHFIDTYFMHLFCTWIEGESL